MIRQLHLRMQCAVFFLMSQWNRSIGERSNICMMEFKSLGSSQCFTPALHFCLLGSCWTLGFAAARKQYCVPDNTVTKSPCSLILSNISTFFLTACKHCTLQKPCMHMFPQKAHQHTVGRRGWRQQLCVISRWLSGNSVVYLKLFIYHCTKHG